MNIGAVERDTGLSKDALRVWERRYGFPVPVRDPLGERAYPLEQVDKLRLLKRLLDQGHRPGKIIHYSLLDLQQLVQQPALATPAAGAGEPGEALLQAYLALCKTHQTEQLRHDLAQALARMGLERFVIELLAPLTRLVGEAWAGGTLPIFAEHAYTESIQTVMRTALSSLHRAHGAAPAQPRILLTTLPQEQHGLGLLMAEAIFMLEGAHCISLGVQTPAMDIVNAARSQGVDIVALSFSEAMNPRQVLEGLADLREKLPPDTELWAGGHCPVLIRRPPASVHVLTSLASIHAGLRDWHVRHPATTLQQHPKI